MRGSNRCFLVVDREKCFIDCLSVCKKLQAKPSQLSFNEFIFQE